MESATQTGFHDLQRLILILFHCKHLQRSLALDIHCWMVSPYCYLYDSIERVHSPRWTLPGHIVNVFNNSSRNSTNKCNPQTALQRGAMKGASSLFSLVRFWLLICFSESWSHSSALWALGLEYTRDLCTGYTVVQRRKREKIECGFEVRICRAAVRACIGCSNRSRAISPPFSSVFLPCASCMYIYIWYKIAYTENLINYIFRVIDLKLWHTAPQVLKAITEKTAQYK